MQPRTNDGPAPTNASTSSKYARVSTQFAPKGRAYTGKLSGLMQVPMDVFFEIASHLRPIDLLQLARTSKTLRSVFLSRTSRSVWLASLNRITGLPPCPTDMTEPAYAALLFDRICMLCSATRSNWVDYAIRLRLCKSCYRAHIKKGKDIVDDWVYDIRNGNDAIRFCMAMTPCETSRYIGIAHTLEAPLSHTKDMKYYGPQLLDSAQRDWPDRLEGQSEEDFLESLCFDSIRRHQHATALLQWRKDTATQKQEEGSIIRERWKESVTQRLKAIGYSEDDFPDSREWDKLVKQPKELTDRIWNNVQPKLLALIHQEAERRTHEEFQARVKLRLHSIAGYVDVVTKQMPESERELLPNTYDLHHLPLLLALAKKDDAQGDVAIADVLALVAELPSELALYKTRAQDLAVKILADSLEARSASEQLLKEEVTSLPSETIITRHYAVFRCNPIFCSTDPRSFRDMHAHWRTAHPQRPWGNVDDTWFIQPFPGVLECQVGQNMLEAAGLPLDTPIDTLTELIRSGRLYCNCQDPALPPPEQLDWPKLLVHVVTDVAQFSAHRRNAKMDIGAADAKYVMRTLHTFAEPDNACIKLLPAGADTAPARERATVIDVKTRTRVEDRLAARPNAAAKHICRVCRNLAATRRSWVMRSLILPDTPEEIVHHLRAWHDKEFQKWDIVFVTL
ncbi:hypothetical protein C8Q73DRAFT_689792 [Cubamyces lactineus]|nr:hypothetical protein C8Q73DRAFT_689792 [Cubamyces lactineus]